MKCPKCGSQTKLIQSDEDNLGRPSGFYDLEYCTNEDCDWTDCLD
jgi:hypothetical protein